MAVDPTVIVATIGGTALVLQSWVGSRHAREAKNIVKGNGHGTVMAVVERIEAKVDSALDWQGSHEALHRRTLTLTEQAAVAAQSAAELSALPSTK